MMRVYFFAALVVSAPAAASQLQYVGTATNESVYQADVQSIRTVNGKPQIWVEEDSTKAKKRYSSAKSLWRYNCANETYLAASWITYGRDGNVIDSQTTRDADWNYEPVAPGTVAEAAMQLVCGQ